MQAPGSSKTALLLIDYELGFTHPSQFGTSISSDKFASKAASLLESARRYNARLDQGIQNDQAAGGSRPIEIIHVHHHSLTPGSALHPGRDVDWPITLEGEDSEAPAPVRLSSRDLKPGTKGTDPLPWAAPLPGERVFVKTVNSAFIGTGLEAFIREKGIRQLIICGLVTDHCVSTTVRMAANLRVCDDAAAAESGRIILVDDACACHEKGGFDAATVHAVNIESLRDEFALVLDTRSVVSKISP